ncbi:unnamed protein product [Bathycoccus prasinos]
MNAALSASSSPKFFSLNNTRSSGRKGRAKGGRRLNATNALGNGSSPSSSTTSSSRILLRTTTTTTISRVLVPNRRQQQNQKQQHQVKATRDDGDDVPFGYTRLDVILIGGGVTGLGFVAYYGLQEFAGFDAQWAGNVVQLTFVMLLTLLWVGSYIQRVFNKDMTYGKQLKDYEEAVMQKRLEEMPESELMALMDESERAKNEK